MPRWRETKYESDPAFRAEVDNLLAWAGDIEIKGLWTIYAIHDPTQLDSIGQHADGPIIYVGQTKQLRKRVEQRLRSSGSPRAANDSTVDAACYKPMNQGRVPKFSVLEHASNAIDSLVLETNWARRLLMQGYPLLNRWKEQRQLGPDVCRADIPHKWIWELSVEDAIASDISLRVVRRATEQEMEIDLLEFPPGMRLREISAALKGPGIALRLHVTRP